MTKPSKSIKARLLAHLEKGRSITGEQAHKLWGTLTVRNRIYDLESGGHHIIHESVRKNGKNFTKYRMP